MNAREWALATRACLIHCRTRANVFRPPSTS